MAHEAELAAALMAHFPDATSLAFSSLQNAKTHHQISSEITQPMKATIAKVATIPR